MALSGPHLAVTNCTAESWWLFLAKSYCRVLVALFGQIVLPSLGGSFWPTFGRNVLPSLVALSGPLAEQIVLPSLGGSFWPTFGRNKSYCRVSVALSGPRLAATNRTAESLWLFLAHVWP